MILSVIPAIKPLLPAPTAPQSIQKMRDWVQTTMARAGTSPSYLYRREMQPGEPVRLECSDFEKQRENSGETRQRGAWDIWVRFPKWWWWHSIFGNRSWISPQKRFPLRKTSIQFNSRTVFISFFFVFPVTEPWDCRHPLCFMHLLTLSFISLKMTYPCWYVCSWSNFNERKLFPWLQCALFAIPLNL